MALEHRRPEIQKTWKDRGPEVQRTLEHREPKERLLTQVPQYPQRKIISRYKGDTAHLRPGCRLGSKCGILSSSATLEHHNGGRLFTSWQMGSREQSCSQPRGQESHWGSSRKCPPPRDLVLQGYALTSSDQLTWQSIMI